MYFSIAEDEAGGPIPVSTVLAILHKMCAMLHVTRLSLSLTREMSPTVHLTAYVWSRVPDENP